MSNRKPANILWIVALMAFAFSVSAQAQDSAPTPTPIPVESVVTQQSAAPVLDQTGVTPQASTPAPETTPQTQNAETTAEAQPASTLPDPVCPALVQESFTATEQVCAGIAPGEGCIGNGTVETIFAGGVDGGTFSSPGNRVRLNSIKELYVRTSGTAGNVWSVVSGRIELNSTDGAVPVAVNSLIFGDATLIDTGEVASASAFSGTVLAQFGMNVRQSPNSNATAIWQLSAGEQIIVTGRTADREWLRMVIPNQFAGTGWVYAPYIEVEGGVDQLPFVTEQSPTPQLAAPEFGTLQSLEFLSAITPPDCDPAFPDSGMLLQTPNGVPDEVRIRFNGAVIAWNGTLFVQGLNDALQISVLEGQANITALGETVAVSAANVAFIPMNGDLQPAAPTVVTALDLSVPATLPLRLLPRAFVVMLPAIEEPAGDDAAQTDPASNPQSCLLTVPAEVRNLRTGPGVEYPVQRVAQPDEILTAVGQHVAAGGYVWYQTTEGAWIRMDAVSASEGCASLPTVEAPPIPATPTADPSLRSLNSSSLGAVVCPAGQVSTSTTWDGSDFSVALGGTWTVSAGTTVTFSTQGGQLRPEFGSYIKVIAEDGSTIAESASNRELRLTFDQNRTFTVRFSAGNGDLIVIAARCEG